MNLSMNLARLRHAFARPSMCRFAKVCGPHLVVVALMTCIGSAIAQVYTFEIQARELDQASKVTPLPEFGEFGDNTDFSSGVTTFRKTLIDLPGNNSTPTTILRFTDPDGRQSMGPNGYGFYLAGKSFFRDTCVGESSRLSNRAQVLLAQNSRAARAEPGNKKIRVISNFKRESYEA